MNPNGNCLGTRFGPDGKIGPYIWETYSEGIHYSNSLTVSSQEGSKFSKWFN